ncbi:HNH endonuclease [Candidatus Palauibacter sp.]|uniref:HNH endonuclease n=1 Tax=Candidatus Palauibacter sp. TaxID=3101350 RepID=UPI003B5CB156
MALRTEPEAFDRIVRRPGLSDMAELVGEDPLPGQGRMNPDETFPDRESIPGRHLRSHWRRARNDLLRTYDQTCAFSGLRVSTPCPPTDDHRLTIDHMVPKSKNWRLVYEWSNLRLACKILNHRKGDSEDVLDPFEVDANGEAWFHMEPVEFRLFPNPNLNPCLQARIKATISRLDLNGPAWLSAREVHFTRFKTHGRLRQVERAFPYVAREIRRLGTESTPPPEVSSDA